MAAPEVTISCSDAKCCSHNAFSALEDVDEFEQVSAVQEKHEFFRPTKCHGTSEHNQSSEENSLLADDELGSKIELLRRLEDLNRIYAAMQVSWNQVAEGSASLLLGSLILERGWRAVCRIEEMMATTAGPKTPEELLEIYQSVKDSLLPDTATPDKSACAFLDDIQRPWSSLSKLKSKVTHLSDDTVSIRLGTKTGSNKPLDHFFQSADGCFAFSEDVQDELLFAAMREPASPFCPCCTGRDYIGQLRKDVHGFLFHKDTSKTIGTSFGLLILQWSYHRHLWPLNTEPTHLNRRNPRLEYLRIEQQVVKAMSDAVEDASMPPCCCTQTLKFRIMKERDSRLKLLQEKKFDLFHQAPWVAAAPMMDSLALAYWLGLRLCSYRGLIGAVLHSYHGLRAVDGIKKVPILEAICNLLTESVFLNERPVKFFEKRYVRFSGGRIKFNCHSHRRGRGNGGGGHDDHRSWELQLPKRFDKPIPGDALATRQSVNDERFETGNVCSYWDLVERSLGGKEDEWEERVLRSVGDYGNGKRKREIGSGIKQKDELASLLQGTSLGLKEAESREDKMALHDRSNSISSITTTASSTSSLPSLTSSPTPSVLDSDTDTDTETETETDIDQSRPSTSTSTSKYNSEPHALSELHTLLHRDFSGPLPPALVNFFAIFASCSRIVDRIHRKTHSLLLGDFCICFAQEVLRAVDLEVESREREKCRCKKRRGKGKESEGKNRGAFCERLQVAGVVREAILKEFRGKEMNDFMWAL